MLTIRPLRWPDDRALLAGLDTSFTTDRVYRIVREELGFTLAEEAADRPLHKEYGPIAGPLSDGGGLECTAVAELDSNAVGFAAARYEPWNRRVVVAHLYVDTRHRGRGIGRALVDHLDGFARSAGARCLWLETQNVNYPAIRFYRRLGFRLCGLDESLYDPTGPAGSEIALFFVRKLTSPDIRG